MDPVSAPPLLKVGNLTFSYPGRQNLREPVLKDISFQGEPGDTVAIMGRSGIGKTTLCRILAGLLPPQSGAVYLNGKPISEPTPQIAISFQESPCFPWLTAAQNVAFAYRGANIDAPNKLIEGLGLSLVKTKYPKDLSGGMRQRVAIGRALAAAPLVLILDEPFSALDIITKRQLRDLLKAEQGARHLLIIAVLHSLEDAWGIADRLIILGGQPAEITADLRVHHPADFQVLQNQVTAAMLGQGELNEP